MKTTINTLVLALVTVCGFGAASAVAGDQESIQGTWTLETATVDGKAMPRVPVEYVFTGDTLTGGVQEPAKSRSLLSSSIQHPSQK